MRHFSDPFVKAVYDTISAGTAGVIYPELQELHPDDADEPGQLRNTLAELRAAGAITSHSGKYWAVQETAAPAAVQVAANTTETTKEQDMSGTSKEGVRAKVWSALVKAGTGNRDEMAMATGLSLKSVTDALYGLKNEGKTQQVARGSRGSPAVYAPADSKRSPGIDIDRAARKAAKVAKAAKAATKTVKAQAAGRPAKTSRKPTTRPTAAPVPALRPTPVRAAPAAPEGFRVGLFSDGTLSIVDADCEMQIDQAKTRALFNYLGTFQAMFAQAAA